MGDEDVQALAILTITQALILAGEPTYFEARQQMAKSGKPMLVMVSAQWCGACLKMKQSVLPELRRQGLLDKFHYAYVDVDENPDLCDRLSNSEFIPELIVMVKTDKGLRSWNLEGLKSADDVKAFLQRAHDRIASRPRPADPR